MIRRVLWSVAVALLVAPTVARADGFFVPYYGQSFGGTLSEIELVSVEERKPPAWGISLGSMGGGIVGFETDVSFSPDFFGESDDTLLGSNSVTTLMGNMLLGAPVGGQSGAGFRPYLVGGLGLIRQRVDGVRDLADFSNNGFGYNVGAGAFIFFGSNFGIRGDFRYFRTFGEDGGFLSLPSLDPGDFSFSRWNAGLVFRF
jgi:opacity protein-like surface antigen